MTPSQVAKPPMALASFLTRLVWLCMLPLLLLAAGLVVNTVLVQQADRDREAVNIAEDFAAVIDQYLEARIGALNILAASPLLDDPRRWPELYGEAQGFQRGFGSHVILANVGEPMQMLFNTRAPYGTPLPLLPRPKGHAAAPTAVASGQPAVGDIVVGPVAQETLVAIAVPALRAGKPTYVVLTTFATSLFQQRLDRVALPAGWSLSLRDGRGDVIARRAPPGLDAAGDVDTSGRFVVACKASQWSAVLEVPRRIRRAPLVAAALALGAGVLGATLFGLIGGIVASRGLGRAVAGLTNAAPDTPLPAIAEIAAARQLLEATASERSAAESSLDVSQERFRRLFEQAPLPLAFVGADGNVVARNARFEQTFGYTAAELHTIDDWWRLAYPDPDYRATVMSGWNAAVARAAAANGDVEPGEYRIACKDGAQRTMLIYGIAMPDGLLATFFDLTERRHAEQALADSQSAALEGQKRARLAALNQMEDANAARRSAEAAAAEIRRLNADLERRVVERTAELSSANRELDAFAYAVSHDLRAPLRAMRGFSQALKEDFGVVLPDEARSYIDEIDFAGHHMGELIDGILALSRSTRGGLERAPVDLSALARRLLGGLAAAEPARTVAWQVEAGLSAYGDARMIEAALANLLGNAWKYTANTVAATIRVYAEDDGGERRFCVADNGAGFDMTHAARLFKPFQRLHRQDEFPGIGIGLATVQRIVHRHGGMIAAQAQPSQGATFCFTLPGVPAAAACNKESDA